jgi:hypothetical protein
MDEKVKERKNERMNGSHHEKAEKKVEKTGP